MDDTAFYQPASSIQDVVGSETVDPPGFGGFGFPCPKHTPCRYSEAAFVDYNFSRSGLQGAIAKTTGTTLSSTPNTDVDPSQQFTITSAPTKAYLSGLILSKVGRRTGWTDGVIGNTCMTVGYSDGSLLLCQYTVRCCVGTITDPNYQIANVSDYGAPVFRQRKFDASAVSSPRSPLLRVSDPVELYGMLWGLVGSPPYQEFAFSPIGGVPLQQTGIQSSTDLGPLQYTACGPIAPASCFVATPVPFVATPVPLPCGLTGPRMCGGSCPNPLQACIPDPADRGCVCK
jgi:hypothetical protein